MTPLILFVLYLTPGLAWTSIKLVKEIELDQQTTTYPEAMTYIAGYPFYLIKFIYERVTNDK